MIASPVPAERRPIWARETRWAVSCASWLAGRGLSPNAISVAGMVFAIVAGVAFSLTGRGLPVDRLLWAVGGLLVALRLLANMFDGMVAFQTGRASPVGELFNEVPDRISDFAVLAGLGYAAASSPVLGWAAASAAVFVAYVRIAAVTAGAPGDFRGPMAKQQRMAAVIFVAAFMSIAPASWVMPGGAGAPAAVLVLIAAGGVATACRRLARARRVLLEHQSAQELGAISESHAPESRGL